MNQKIFAAIFVLSSIGGMNAQVVKTTQTFNPTGINNQGLVGGYIAQGAPYALWNPDNGEFTPIGGVGPGDGIGGWAKFSGNGLMTGVTWGKHAPGTDWKKGQITSEPAKFVSFHKSRDNRKTVWAVYQDKENEANYILTTNDGVTWGSSLKTGKKVLNSMALLDDQVVVACGDNAFFAYSTNAGLGWNIGTSPRPEGVTDEVVSFTVMDFVQDDPYHGLIGVELAGKQGTLYFTPDGCETWESVEGFNPKDGVPTCITHTDSKTFFVGTSLGRIYRSADSGKTWKLVLNTQAPFSPVSPIHKIAFSSDHKTGIAVSNYGVAYLTNTAGYDQWQWNAFAPSDDAEIVNTNFKDVFWKDEDTAIMVGTKGACWVSSDKGGNWTHENLDESGTASLNCLFCTDDLMVSGADNGVWFAKNLHEEIDCAKPALYSLESQEWKELDDLGFVSNDLNRSAASPYKISGDGKTVVGLAKYANPQVIGSSFAHAVAWNESGRITDLGSLHDNICRSTRANDVSYDGSVIVGWQDERGPWQAAYWKKQGDGSYEQKLVWADPAGEKEESNKLFDARVVSADGKWIGGRGISTTVAPLSLQPNALEDTDPRNQPWLWSEETGVKYLGMPVELKRATDPVGHVAAVNNDGTIAAGFITYNSNSMMAFIWTEAEGMKSLDAYLNDKFGYTSETNDMCCSVLDMSPNGRYLTGWGIENYSTLFSFRIDLLHKVTGIDEVNRPEAIVTAYPNPATDRLHVDLPYAEPVQATLVDMQGKTVYRAKFETSENVIDVASLPAGMYILHVQSAHLDKSCKVMVRH